MSQVPAWALLFGANALPIKKSVLGKSLQSRGPRPQIMAVSASTWMIAAQRSKSIRQKLKNLPRWEIGTWKIKAKVWCLYNHWHKEGVTVWSTWVSYRIHLSWKWTRSWWTISQRSKTDRSRSSSWVAWLIELSQVVKSGTKHASSVKRKLPIMVLVAATIVRGARKTMGLASRHIISVWGFKITVRVYTSNSWVNTRPKKS